MSRDAVTRWNQLLHTVTPSQSSQAVFQRLVSLYQQPWRQYHLAESAD